MEKFLERISLASPAPPRKRNKQSGQLIQGSGGKGQPGGEIPGRKPLPRQGQCLESVMDLGLQVCPLTVTPLGQGKSVTVSERHYNKRFYSMERIKLDTFRIVPETKLLGDGT